MATKRQINEFLYRAFAMDTEGEAKEKISQAWPFELEEMGTVDIDGARVDVFRFESNGEAYYALGEPRLRFFPAGKFDLGALKLELMGSSWIENRDPVDLRTSCEEHEFVPRPPERRERILEIARRLRSDQEPTILEGLFLKQGWEYLALVCFEDEDVAHIVGDRITLRNIPYPEASPRRRLSLGIGRLIETEKIETKISNRERTSAILQPDPKIFFQFPAMGKGKRIINDQKTANQITLVCLLTSVIGGGFGFVILGGEGMEALGGIIPLALVGLVHLIGGPMAIFFAYKTYRIKRNLHVYFYFLLFLVFPLVVVGYEILAYHVFFIVATTIPILFSFFGSRNKKNK